MKRVFVLALGLFVAPAVVSAQVEVGLDAGFAISMLSEPDGFTGDLDNLNSFALPGQWVRVGFMAGDMLLIEPMVGFEWFSEGDYSENTLLLLPGVNFLLGEQFYVRGEAGLLRYSESDDSFDFSTTQYGFGGGAGLRLPVGDAAMVRFEAAVTRWLEVEDNGVIEALGRTDIRIGAGISAVIN